MLATLPTPSTESPLPDDPPRLGGTLSLADVDDDWLAIQVKANQEKRLAFDMLRNRQGTPVPYYLPMGESVTCSGRKRRVIQVPLLKGYVFVAPPAALDRAILFSTHRTIRVIAIRDQITFRRELANIERATAACPRIEPCPYAVTGRRVRIYRGAFEGIEGIVIRRGEGTIIVVSVSGFGNATLEIDGNLIEPV